MKQVTWVLLLLCLPCLSQENIQRTNGGANGRFWADLSRTSKLYFLMGLDEGIGHAAPFSEKLYFPNVPFGDVMKGLDRFYQEPENLMFPVHTALQVFTLKVNGATQAQVEAKIAQFRREIIATQELLTKPSPR